MHWPLFYSFSLKLAQASLLLSFALFPWFSLQGPSVSQELEDGQTSQATSINLVPAETESKEKDSAHSDLSAESSYLIIPALDIEAPIIFPPKLDLALIIAGLKKGVVHFSSSALPGEPGTTIILGHSAPSGWPTIRYDWVFSRINKLRSGDAILVNYQGKDYRYIVEGSAMINKNEELKTQDEDGENVLILMTCWPPGVDYKRIIVKSELVSVQN